MPSNLQRKPVAHAPGQWRLLQGGKASRHAELAKPIVVLLVLATLFRLWTALGGSQGIIAEDTYSVLRQGRNWLQHGQYAFNLGAETTSAPLTLTGLLLAPIQSVFGRGTPWFLLVFNAVLWTCAILTLLRPMRPSVRPGVALLLCLAPAFVDGALHGSDAEWLGFLIALSYASISVGRTAQSLVWFSLAILSSPATCLFAPVWLSVHCSRLGLSFGLRSLVNLRNLAAIAIPMACWAWFSNNYTQDGFAGPWIHWASQLSSPWTSLEALWIGLPRYTLLAGSQYFPIWAQHAFSAFMFILLAHTVRTNLKFGTASSRGWLCFYLLLVAFGTGVSGSALSPATSVLPAMAFTMALIPVLLPLVPRFHGTRLLRASALVLGTLAMPIAFAAMSQMRSKAHNVSACADSLLQAQSGQASQAVLTTQAGLLGYLYEGTVLNAIEAVAPDQSFTHLALEQGTPWIMLSDSSLQSNQVDGLGAVWANDAERTRWDAAYRTFATHGEWLLFKKLQP